VLREDDVSCTGQIPSLLELQVRLTLLAGGLQVFEGICRPLKIRIEQVLLSSPSMVVCFNLYQLLSFYGTTVDQVMGGVSALSKVLAQVRDMSANSFNEQIKNKTDKLRRIPPCPDRALSCPSEIRDVVRQLLDVVEAFESSLNAGMCLH
jgi:conserved oligomeric Golgi complex subunit 6